MSKIIGLLGPAGSGKSTIGQYLVEKFGAKKYSFAYPLKEIVRRAFDLTEDQVFGSQHAKERVDPRYNVSARWLMQRIGTEGIREVLGADFWWKNCLERIQAEQPELAVIEDFRFENEVNGFLALNEGSDPDRPPVNIWRIEHPADRDTEADQTHQSEAEWSKCRFTNIVKPEEVGLLELYYAADEAALESNLTATQKVLR
jgi:hypothetical protein